MLPVPSSPSGEDSLERAFPGRAGWRVGMRIEVAVTVSEATGPLRGGGRGGLPCLPLGWGWLWMLPDVGRRHVSGGGEGSFEDSCRGALGARDRPRSLGVGSVRGGLCPGGPKEHSVIW